MKTAFPNALSKSAKWFTSRKSRMVLALTGVAGAVTLMSCVTVHRAMTVPPEIPGAEFIGSAACAECHAETTKHFAGATHERLMAQGKNALNIGCESCHGAGSLHQQSGGGAGTIINPHKSPDVCFQCHLEKRGQFSLPSHHPVIEGKVSCSDCHDPHKGNAIMGGGTQMLSENETCGKCHTAQFGPFVFEHEAMREGCTTCHDPHGSVNEKMLVSRNNTLCLKCHFQQQTVSGRIYIGGRDHNSFINRGACWSAGCHEAVHGSQIGSSMRF